jgi:hypothetical protein
MVRLCVEEDGRVRVEAPDVPDAPELRTEQVWLCDAEEDQQGDCAGQLEGHYPEHGRSLPPRPVEGLITPVPFGIPSRHSICHCEKKCSEFVCRPGGVLGDVSLSLVSPFALGNRCNGDFVRLLELC